jgi:hypothetical protein
VTTPTSGQPKQSRPSSGPPSPAEARRLFELTEPLAAVTYSTEATEAVMAHGLPSIWAAYFAGRAAPLGRDVPAEVVHALFYNFADGEVARYLPGVWDHITPRAACVAREQASVAVLRRDLGDLADDPSVSRAADLLLRAAMSASTDGRPLYAAVRTLPIPGSPLARLWHGANLLREHRGDGHNTALLAAGVGGTESHVLRCLASRLPAAQDGRLEDLPAVRLDAVVAGMRRRGLVGEDGWLTQAGQQVKSRVEAKTDELAAPAYAVLDRTELDELVRDLTPLVETLAAAD